jgi:hypothetical protein
MPGLVDQQMHVFRHDDVAGNHKEIAAADALQRIFKQLHGRDRRQAGSAAITTEGEEVKLPGLLIADALAFHALQDCSTAGLGKKVLLPSPVPNSEGPGAPST